MRLSIIWRIMEIEQAVCVKRFDQSECVISWVIFALGKSRFQRDVWWNFRFIPSLCGKFDNIPPWKVVGTLILIAVALLLNIFLSWTFVTSLICLLMCEPPWWFECYFRRSSWIHCWLLLAILSDYFGQLVTSTFLLRKFWGLALLVSPLWGVESVSEWRDRLSQVVQLPGYGLRIVEAKADVKRVTQNPGRVFSILNEKR